MKTYFTLLLSSITFAFYAQVADFKTVNFIKADNTAKLNDGESLNDLPALSHKLTDNLATDAEKFRAIFYWVCANIEADNAQNTTIIANRRKFKNDSLAYLEWNRRYSSKAFRKLFKNKKTTCTGYAFLIKELCFSAGISCNIINGYGRTIEDNVKSLDLTNHSWNAVKLNNKWYLCDAAWASGYLDERGNFIKEFNDGYFLTDPELFAKNHVPIEKKWLLTADTNKSTEGPPPLVYGETFKLNIIPVAPDKMVLRVKNGEILTFSFKDATNNKRIPSLIRILQGKEDPYAIYDIQHDNGITSFKYKCNGKGNFDVHLKLENYIAATYCISIQEN